MKVLFPLVVGLLIFQTSRATVLLEDHFNYSNGNLGASGVGDGVWTSGDSPSAAIRVTNAATLNYPGLADTAGSGVVFSGTTFKKRSAPFSAQSSGSVYCSFLLNIQSAPASTKLFLWLHNGGGGTSSPGLGIFLNGYEVGLAKHASSPAVTANIEAGTHFIVARYTFQTGNDQVDLWVDPASLGDSGNIPAATLTTGTASSSDISTLSYVVLNHGISQTLWIDELRVGTTWADVTPASGPKRVPRMMSAWMCSDGLVLAGTNGPASGSYVVLATTNLALPPTQWQPIATNTFNTGGDFVWTNPVMPGLERRFYRLLLGNVGPTVPVPPEITTQPVDQTIGVGGNVTFSVVAAGTTPLSYQWYFNTDTLLTDETNATLTIDNVQTNDAGGYWVTVANVAGSATSAVAVLTVTGPSAPSITTQPQNQVAMEGGSAAFMVVAAGTPPLSYQWYFDTDTSLADETNATLALSNVGTNAAGDYTVVITNDLGAVTSVVATLTVYPAPTNVGSLQILQAEDATFTGSVSTEHSGYTGSGFVDTANATGSYIEWKFGRQHAGTEMLFVRYAHNKSDDRTASVTVNGVIVISSMDFPPTGSWTSWQLVSNAIPVQAGMNKLRLTALTSGGLANIDCIEVSGDPQFKLKIVLNGRGAVMLDPTNDFAYYNPGTEVTLTAVPQTNSVFVGWSGDLTGTNNPETLVVDSNKTVTAQFNSIMPSIIYVSPTGDDSNPGTIDQPLYSLSVAVATVEAGDIIYMRGGTYSYAATVPLNKAGTSSNPISILAYPGERPVLNYSSWQPASEAIRSGARGIKVLTNAAWWVLKGLEICYAPDNGCKCEGSHIVFDQCVFHHNGDGGLQIGLNKDTLSSNPDPENWAAYNLVTNCDSYRNADPATSYENADGFSCKLYAGKGNHFYGCRSWENCDDGWDCYQTDYEIVIENCWSWHNGDPSLWGFSSFNGDGNGFKLGGASTYCPINIRNCVALNCQWGTTVGFAYNDNTAPITLYNSDALNCGRPYNLQQDGNIIKNCVDYNATRPAPTDISSSSIQQNNSWNLGITVTADDFVSMSEADAAASRQADGSLPNNGFARLKSTSSLIDKGADVGLPFNGTAPDLGAFEYSP